MTTPDQSPQAKALTDLLGTVQRDAEDAGWSTEIVSVNLSETPSVILGLTSPAPDNFPFSLQANLTP